VFVKGLKPHELNREAFHSSDRMRLTDSASDQEQDNLLRRRLAKSKAMKGKRAPPPKAKSSGNLDAEMSALLGR